MKVGVVLVKKDQRDEEAIFLNRLQRDQLRIYFFRARWKAIFGFPKFLGYGGSAERLEAICRRA